MKNFYTIIYFLTLLSIQKPVLAESEPTCDEIATKIRHLKFQLEEIDRNWISRKIPNKSQNLLNVPAEIAWKSLAIYDNWGSVPSSGLVYASHYPLNQVYYFLADKGLAGNEVDIFYKASSLATMMTIFPLGVAINLVSYSSAFTYNELFKSMINRNIEKLDEQYKAACS